MRTINSSGLDQSLRIGYKLLEVQIPEASTSTRTKEGCPTAPQEPVGPSRKQEEGIQPPTSSPLQMDAAIQTEGIELQISCPVQMDAAIQTEEIELPTVHPLKVDAAIQTEEIIS